MDELDPAVFHHPPAESRLAPFWFWNTRMTPTMVRRQVEAMSRGGVGGFFIHPRQGLDVPYLSAEWFDLVRVAVESAAELGMQAWLYDEYPYPSGIAGGLVTATHPQLKVRDLSWHTFDIDGGGVEVEMPLGRIVSCLAVPMENGVPVWEKADDLRDRVGVVLRNETFLFWELPGAPYNRKRFTAEGGVLRLKWTAPAGACRIVAAVERERSGFKYYDCFVDPIQPGAAELFIQLTHERYAAAIGEHFGKSVPGIFTDEIEAPAWSPVLQEELERRDGLDLSLLAPALRFDDHPRSREVRHRAAVGRQRLFHERWEKPIADWCADRGLVWVAEKPVARPREFAHVHEPGTDAGHLRVGRVPAPLTASLRANNRAAAAVAEQTGRRRVRCECFHSLGWGATLQDQKWQFDWLAVQGVNRFTHHAFYASSSGLRKHDAAPSFFLETPAWTHFKRLADYAARLSLTMSRGREVAPVAVLYPSASLWIGGGSAVRCRKAIERIMADLLRGHRTFHVVDAGDVARGVVDASWRCVRVGQAVYRALIVPPLVTADADTRDAIARVREANAPVLAFEPVDDCDVAGMTPGKALADAGMRAAPLDGDWLVELERLLPGEVAIDGDDRGDVWLAHRRTESREIVFLANTANADAALRLRLPGGQRRWQRWSLEDGGVEEAALDVARPLPIGPLESVLLVGEAVPADGVPAPAIIANAVVALDLGGDWDITVDHPNALRLNHWRVACDNADWSDVARDDASLPEIEALPLRHIDTRFGRVARDLAPRQPSAPVWYRRRVSCRVVPADLRLLLEDGAIDGNWTLFVNAVPVSRERFVPFALHGDDKLAAPLHDLFRTGENLLSLRIDDPPLQGGLRTPLHLVGTFALTGPDRRVIDEPIRRGVFADPVAVGLPHFAGTIRYRRFARDCGIGSRHAGIVLGLPRDFPFTDVIELLVDGCALGVRGWKPYRWNVPSDLPIGPGSTIEFRVTNTLLPFFEGQQWDPVRASASDV